ncbi:MAG: hypothetical protein GYB64_14845, partial [Chloroflexi bacterium]|nr:hypothetical protein [Chloroflexota bacterium]
MTNRWADLPPARRAALEALLKSAAARPIIPVRPDPGVLPLTFGQERIWFLEQAGTGHYVELRALRISGPLDVAALERSLQAVVDRHPVLQATFVERGGRPHQLIGGEVPFETGQAHDLPHAVATLQQAAGHPVDVAVGPLCRAVLLTCGPREHVLGLLVHSLVMDGLSLP